MTARNIKTLLYKQSMDRVRNDLVVKELAKDDEVLRKQLDGQLQANLLQPPDIFTESSFDFDFTDDGSGVDILISYTGNLRPNGKADAKVFVKQTESE